MASAGPGSDSGTVSDLVLSGTTSLSGGGVPARAAAGHSDTESAEARTPSPQPEVETSPSPTRSRSPSAAPPADTQRGAAVRSGSGRPPSGARSHRRSLRDRSTTGDRWTTQYGPCPRRSARSRGRSDAGSSSAGESRGPMADAGSTRVYSIASPAVITPSETPLRTYSPAHPTDFARQEPPSPRSRTSSQEAEDDLEQAYVLALEKVLLGTARDCDGGGLGSGAEGDAEVILAGAGSTRAGPGDPLADPKALGLAASPSPPPSSRDFDLGSLGSSALGKEGQVLGGAGSTRAGPGLVSTGTGVGGLAESPPQQERACQVASSQVDGAGIGEGWAGSGRPGLDPRVLGVRSDRNRCWRACRGPASTGTCSSSSFFTGRWGRDRGRGC